MKRFWHGSNISLVCFKTSWNLEGEGGYLPERSVDKETWKFLSWAGTGTQSREVSSVFQEDTPKPAPILCLFPGAGT